MEGGKEQRGKEWYSVGVGSSFSISFGHFGVEKESKSEQAAE